MGQNKVGGRQLLLDPEAHRVPGAAKNAGLLHPVQGHQGHVQQRLGAAHDMEARMDDLAAEEAGADLAERAYWRATIERRLQRLLLAAIEMEEAHRSLAGVVGQARDELASWSVGDLEIGRAHV